VLHDVTLPRRVGAEVLGTALLVVAVVGSGIAAERLSPNDVGVQLLENAAATGLVLAVIILVLGPVSGAHLNPVVTLLVRADGGTTNRDALAYVGGQFAGAVIGTFVAHAMFDVPVLQASTHTRSAGHLWLAEILATAGLVLVVFGLGRGGNVAAIPFAVGGYIAAAYFFTSSTSFANPAVTVARAFTDTFSGIRPSSVPAFVIAQCAGGALGYGAVRFFFPAREHVDA
jgi:glycerol uptake facilitator-like aquaporin